MVDTGWLVMNRWWLNGWNGWKEWMVNIDSIDGERMINGEWMNGRLVNG